jgi:hypothetical protein
MYYNLCNSSSLACYCLLKMVTTDRNMYRDYINIYGVTLDGAVKSCFNTYISSLTFMILIQFTNFYEIWYEINVGGHS